ncbi:oligosaccharide flippase family protein [Pseudoalteromonas sp. MB47]|uniref:oligosaccharide flippase family protein n=1 Tax=Pseudoalteromonas sp. MB47 TaxID=2588452 RepID=UPI00140D8CDB|nr:oligosaccharide flippase family protein [Pseudoalteromonas sp. MB47]NHH89264.1 Teichuronic acid biosynthesis protein TuaB [Pseudoalteromonas sp. MB47]
MSTKKQGIWLLASSAISGAVQFAVFAMLAYYTNPQVIGVLAIINVFLAIAYLVQDMGLSNYFIYKQTLTRSESSALYYTNVFLGAGAGGLIALIALPVANFYESKDIAESLYIMAFNFVLLGLSAQYQANFIKSEKNVALAKIDIVTKLCLLIFTFGFIKIGIPSIFPYLYAFLATNSLRYMLFLFFAEKSWHPTYKVDFTIVKPALAFGGFQMGSQILNQVRAQLDQLIIGKLMGVEVLGLYSFAKELLMQPIKFIRILIARLVYPKLAKLQDQGKQFYDTFERSVRLLTAMNSAVYLIFLGGLTLAVWLFFEQYQQSIPLLYALFIIGCVAPFGSLLGMAAQAKGNTKIEFQWNLLSSSISICALLILTQLKSISLFAFGVAALQMIMTASALFFFSKGDSGLPKRTYLFMFLMNVLMYLTVNGLYQLFLN